MEPIKKDVFRKKAQELDLARGQALKIIQEILDDQFSGRTKTKSLNDGVLKIITPSSAVASDLRLQQTALVEDFRSATNREIKRLVIHVGSI